MMKRMVLASAGLIAVISMVAAVVTKRESAQPDASPGHVVRIGEMTSARAAHQATPLGSGEIPIIGGCSGGCDTGLRSAELYEPDDRVFRPAAAMAIARDSHVAVALADGRVLVAGEWSQGPERVSICHCLACQKRTGSVFGAQARFHADAVTIAGQSTAYERIGDEGGAARFHFCPACGSTVFYMLDAMPDVVAIPVGAFADPDFPQPRVSVYEVREHRWVRLLGDTEHFD